MENHPTMFAIIREAYQIWKAHLSMSPVEIVPGHLCSGSCEYLKHECVYICKLTGNVHFCTLEMCDSIIQTAEFSMCTKTHVQYPLHMVTHTDTETVDFGGKVSILPKLPRQKGPRPHPIFRQQDLEPMKQSVRDLLNALLLGSTSSAAIMAPSKRARINKSIQPHAVLIQHTKMAAAAQEEETIEHRRHSSAALSKQVLKKRARRGPIVNTRRFKSPIVRKIAPTELTEDFYQRVITHCISSWHKITNTRLFKSQTVKYEFKNHCLAVLYKLRTGFAGNGGILLPCEPLLRDGLQNRTRLKELGLVKAYTAATTLFMQCASELAGVPATELRSSSSFSASPLLSASPTTASPKTTLTRTPLQNHSRFSFPCPPPPLVQSAPTSIVSSIASPVGSSTPSTDMARQSNVQAMNLTGSFCSIVSFLCIYLIMPRLTDDEPF